MECDGKCELGPIECNSGIHAKIPPLSIPSDAALSRPHRRAASLAPQSAKMRNLKGKTVKTCSLCLLPRPDHEPVCAICDNDEFTAAEWQENAGLEHRLLVENHLDM